MLFARQADPAHVVSFLEDFCNPPWTLVAWRSNGGRWLETRQCTNKQEAFSFVSKHRNHMLRFLLGYSRLPLTNAPEPGDLLMSCGVAACMPLAKVRNLPVPPAALIDASGYGIAAWRYITHTHAAIAARKIADFAARFSQSQGCPVKPLSLMMPVPGQAGFDLVFQRKGEVIDILSFDSTEPRRPRQTKPEDEDEQFVRGDQATASARELPVIKKGWVPGDAITLFIGREKYGKSMGVAKLASYITSGGSWEHGGWRAGWFDGTPVLPEARGSVIICEEEDPRLETLARLKAAGCDMSKVHVRVMVPDIGNPAKLRQITKLSESLSDNRMISFSPLSSALRLRNYTEDAVRDKLRPLQSWVRGRGVAIIGIVHLDNEGRTSGSAVIPRVCRSGITFEDSPYDKDARQIRVSLSNSGKMGVTMPYRIEEARVTIDGTQIDTARMLFK